MLSFLNIFRMIKKHYFLLITFILIILFFYPTLFSGKTFFFRDIHRLFYPMKYFLASSFKSGSIPYWSPNYFCGSPFISNIQAGVLYPVSLLYLLFPFPLSFNLFIILHFFLGFCFFYLFIKGLGLSKYTAIIMSISYCYGGYTIASLNTLNNLTTSVWLPAILWAFQKGMIKDDKSWLFLSLLFLCMSILGGEPQLFIMTSGLLFLYGIICIPDKISINRSIRFLITFLILIISAFILTIIQLGPTYIDYQHSVRLGGISYEDAARYSMGLGMLKHLLFPLKFPSYFTTDPAILKNFFPSNGNLPWLLTIYPGFIILPLALFALFSRPIKNPVFWLVIFVTTLILALGNNTPVFHVFYRILPYFRFPEKFVFLSGFSLLVLGAYGFDKLISFIEKRL